MVARAGRAHAGYVTPIHYSLPIYFGLTMKGDEIVHLSRSLHRRGGIPEPEWFRNNNGQVIREPRGNATPTCASAVQYQCHSIVSPNLNSLLALAYMCSPFRGPSVKYHSFILCGLYRFTVLLHIKFMPSALQLFTTVQRSMTT